MSALLLLTNALQASAEVLPSLALLHHQVRILPAEVCAGGRAGRGRGDAGRPPRPGHDARRVPA